MRQFQIKNALKGQKLGTLNMFYQPDSIENLISGFAGTLKPEIHQKEGKVEKKR